MAARAWEEIQGIGNEKGEARAHLGWRQDPRRVVTTCGTGSTFVPDPSHAGEGNALP